jgi:hypothetical protein
MNIDAFTSCMLYPFMRVRTVFRVGFRHEIENGKASLDKERLFLFY